MKCLYVKIVGNIPAHAHNHKMYFHTIMYKCMNIVLWPCMYTLICSFFSISSFSQKFYISVSVCSNTHREKCVCPYLKSRSCHWVQEQKKGQSNTNQYAILNTGEIALLIQAALFYSRKLIINFSRFLTQQSLLKY